MILITDSNILFSALIKPTGIVASILKKEKKFQFVAPNYLKEEIRIHWDKIKNGTDLSVKELQKEWKFYQEHIHFFDEYEISDEDFYKAYEVVKDIDEKDVIFVASHFHTKLKVWSSDETLVKAVREKGYTKIFITTSELKKQLYKKKK